jgi:hypothetical protein
MAVLDEFARAVCGVTCVVARQSPAAASTDEPVGRVQLSWLRVPPSARLVFCAHRGVFAFRSRSADGWEIVRLDARRGDPNHACMMQCIFSVWASVRCSPRPAEHAVNYQVLDPTRSPRACESGRALQIAAVVLCAASLENCCDRLEIERDCCDGPGNGCRDAASARTLVTFCAAASGTDCGGVPGLIDDGERGTAPEDRGAGMPREGV